MSEVVNNVPLSTPTVSVIPKVQELNMSSPKQSCGEIFFIIVLLIILFVLLYFVFCTFR